MWTVKPSWEPSALNSIDASLRAEAEAEVVALMHLDGAQLFEQDAADEVFGTLLREFGGEGKDHGGVDAGGGEEVEALG